jgi:hypothetical protein
MTGGGASQPDSMIDAWRVCMYVWACTERSSSSGTARARTYIERAVQRLELPRVALLHPVLDAVDLLLVLLVPGLGVDRHWGCVFEREGFG